MRRLATAGLVAGTVLSLAPAAYAAPSPTGVLCGYSAGNDPQIRGAQTGEVDAGPLFWTDNADDTAVATSSGSVTCTIQVNQPTHAGGDACTIMGPEAPVVGVAAGTCTYLSDANDDVYLCTEATVNGTTLYYAATLPTGGGWSTDPNSSCGLLLLHRVEV